MQKSLVHVKDQELVFLFGTKVDLLGLKLLRRWSSQNGTDPEKIHHILVDQIV